MKRHAVLQPFSRDHNVGLVIARRLSERPDEHAIRELVTIWDDEMRDHFEEEERLLIPLSESDHAARMIAEHRIIEGMIAKAQSEGLSLDEIRTLGKLLGNHIRWEERVLFPALESNCSLESIADATDSLEKRRADSRHSPRRAELVQKNSL